MINTAKDDNNGDDNDDNAAAQRRRGESRATTCRPHLTITVAKATKAQVGIVIIIVIIVIIILIKICFQGGGSVPRLLFGLAELSGSAQGSVGPPGGGTQWCSVGPSGT